VGDDTVAAGEAVVVVEVLEVIDVHVEARAVGAVGEPDQHESAAAEIAGLGPRDGQCQRHGYRGIDGVSAAFHHVRADA